MLAPKECDGTMQIKDLTAPFICLVLLVTPGSHTNRNVHISHANLLASKIQATKERLVDTKKDPNYVADERAVVDRRYGEHQEVLTAKQLQVKDEVINVSSILWKLEHER